MSQVSFAQALGERIAQERRLKSVRDRADIGQKDVADTLGVSAGTVSRWESGDVVPRDDVLLKLADYFGVTPAWLRYGQEPREVPRAELPAVNGHGPPVPLPPLQRAVSSRDLKDHVAEKAKPPARKAGGKKR